MGRLWIFGVLVFALILSFPTGETLADNSLNLNSESAILIDAKTGEILYEKNSRKTMYPASITKIVTGIIALEQGNLEDTVTVSEKARNAHGTRVYLLEGEKVPLKKLVQGMLINSGNDAAIAIAEYFDGSTEKFAKRMNQFVQEQVGVKNSNFVNPHGLFNENHYTTAYDMAKITQYAMKNDTFREIVGTRELKWNGEGWDTTLYNHNELLSRYDGTTGVKNGWVPQSGYTLVSSAKRGRTELIAVTLKSNTSENAYEDTIALFDYGFANFETNKISKGKVFRKDEAKYVLKTDLFYTKKKGASIIEKVTDSGDLMVKMNSKVILKEKLVQIEPKQQNDDNEKTTIEEDSSLYDSIIHFIIHPIAH